MLVIRFALLLGHLIASSVRWWSSYVFCRWDISRNVVISWKMLHQMVLPS